MESGLICTVVPTDPYPSGVKMGELVHTSQSLRVVTTLELSLPPSLPPSLSPANANITSSSLARRAPFEMKTGQLMGATLYSTGDNFVVRFYLHC